jgi:hypothetical protein
MLWTTSDDATGHPQRWAISNGQISSEPAAGGAAGGEAAASAAAAAGEGVAAAGEEKEQQEEKEKEGGRAGRSRSSSASPTLDDITSYYYRGVLTDKARGAKTKSPLLVAHVANKGTGGRTRAPTTTSRHEQPN